MKTSNKLILIALGLILISLFGYDLLLKGEYMSGNYKMPYRDFVDVNFKDFDIADLNSSTAANVKFIQGPYNVRIDKNASDYIKITQQGNRLQVDAIFEGDYLFNPNPYVILISCPKLKEVNTNASYRSNRRQVTDTIVRDDWNMRQVLIDGFRQDSLRISQDFGSTIVLSNNNIQSISGVIGKSESSGSKIIIQYNNHFHDASLDIRNKSSLLLENAMIDTLSYHLADSAKLIVSGSAQNLLNHSKHSLK